MGSRRLNIIAAALATLLLVALLWVFLAPGGDGSGNALGPKRLEKGSNPNLDVRFEYDARYFSVGPFIDNAEFPFLLEGDGWLMQGKRIRGMARLLHKEPISALYDWLGVMQMEGLERYFDLAEAEAPVYEDWQVGGRLAVHQKLVYETTKPDPQLPGYFPETVQAMKEKGQRVYIEGWVFFTDQDLFFFQAVSPQPLSEEHRRACDEVLQSMQFNALMGAGREPPAAEPESEGEETP